jgi:CRISPR/Cas system-associated exonuclease Cas4 (RecB family)
MEGGMSPPDRTAYLSKSLYIRGLQCHKSLYLDRHQPELRAEPTPELEALWAGGHEVGDFAHMLFPGGVIVPFDGLTRDEQLAKTRAEIDRGTKAIYEATFSHDDVFVKADIIVRNRGYWDLYEVKSSTSVKEHHWDDVAVQYYVLSGCGLPMHKAYLVHVNNSYVREGDIVPEELFVLQDITGIVKEKQAAIQDTLAEMRAMLRGKMPEIDIGPHCEDPYECDFTNFCWRHVPADSVFSIRGRGIDQWELYRQGVVRLEDVPLKSLNLMQRMQVEYFLDRKSHADPAKVREFLKKVWYPVCFLDFETFASAIPLFDGTRPYQQVPFQYSMHRIDGKGAQPKHFEYLAQPGVDPRNEIAVKLPGEIPEGACVLVYNMAFEKRVLRELGEFLPGARKRLHAVSEGMIDLMEPFKRRDIYHWRMNGSYSLKSVLPVLVPEMTYEGLEIRDGAMASEAYFAMENIADPAELARLRAALLEYCRRDTLGLVRLLEKMQTV